MMAERSLPWSSRVVYGIGKAPDIIKLLSFDSFILFYYSQVLGLPGTLAGLTIFLVICADAIWDPTAATRSGGKVAPDVFIAADRFDPTTSSRTR